VGTVNGSPRFEASLGGVTADGGLKVRAV